MMIKRLRVWCRGALGALIVSALAVSISVQAQPDEPEFNVSSAAVLTIKNSLISRHRQLIEHFQSGVIGLTYDGQVAVRDAKALDKEARSVLESLIVEDNKDRLTLYREMARSNGRPDWEGSWRTIFAERWISRAPAGWYYREYSGRWVKKP